MNINKKFFNQSGANTVDIVVIGRNEGELLRDALNSVIEASNYFQQMGYPRPKIIYVDGQSTDGSLELAKSLDVDTYIVKDKPTPPAGRHLGLAKCKGKYIFFLDGDTIVHREWLIKGVQYLEKSSDVAGVGGILDWEFWENGKVKSKKSNYSNIRKNEEQVYDGVGGNFLYRCDVLNRVGNWNQTMIRNGEFELHLRIAHAGYRLARVSVPMATHRDNKTNSSKTFLQRHILNSNIFIPGVIIRRAPKSLPVLKLLFYRYWLYLLHPVAVLGILIFFSLYFYVQSVKWIMFGIVTAIFLFIAHYFYKGKDLRRSIISVLTMNVFSFGWLIGLFVRWPSWDGRAQTMR